VIEMSKRMERWIIHLMAGLDEYVDEETSQSVGAMRTTMSISKLH